jgi:hypothetical protein
MATVAISAGRVVGGVYLFQNRRDLYWFLEVLIRDPADEYRGVGFDVVQSAAAWWKRYASDGSQLRVHSMQREKTAVAGQLSWVARALARLTVVSLRVLRDGSPMSLDGWTNPRAVMRPLEGQCDGKADMSHQTP